MFPICAASVCVCVCDGVDAVNVMICSASPSIDIRCHHSVEVFFRQTRQTKPLQFPSPSLVLVSSVSIIIAHPHEHIQKVDWSRYNSNLPVIDTLAHFFLVGYVSDSHLPARSRRSSTFVRLPFRNFISLHCVRVCVCVFVCVQETHRKRKRIELFSPLASFLFTCEPLIRLFSTRTFLRCSRLHFGRVDYGFAECELQVVHYARATLINSIALFEKNGISLSAMAIGSHRRRCPLVRSYRFLLLMPSSTNIMATHNAQPPGGCTQNRCQKHTRSRIFIGTYSRTNARRSHFTQFRSESSIISFFVCVLVLNTGHRNICPFNNRPWIVVVAVVVMSLSWLPPLCECILSEREMY